MRSQRFYLPGLALCILLVAYVPRPNAEPVIFPHGTVELIAEKTAIQPGHSFHVGLHFVLENGWHIYWINPGDSGQPPRVAWQLPAGVNPGSIEWPLPKRLTAFSAVDFGYEDEVLLLVPMKASPALQAGTRVNLAGDIKLLICSDVCVPAKAHVLLPLPVKNQAASLDDTSTAIFKATRRALPRRPPAQWNFTVTNQKDYFRLTGAVGRSIKQAFFFPLQPNQIENAAPQAVRPTEAGFTITLKESDQLLKPIRRLQGILLLENRAYSIDAPVK
jgi:DsbC/DsbD-like thiol-disulfide interchange protein